MDLRFVYGWDYSNNTLCFFFLYLGGNVFFFSFRFFIRFFLSGFFGPSFRFLLLGKAQYTGPFSWCATGGATWGLCARGIFGSPFFFFFFFCPHLAMANIAMDGKLVPPKSSKETPNKPRERPVRNRRMYRCAYIYLLPTLSYVSKR